MSAEPPAVCPLCQRQVSRAELCAHIADEHPLRRHNTIKLIQAYHPGWQAENGVCWPCWKSYRDATQALNFLKPEAPPSLPRK